jgi:hypothetical protein
MDFIKLFGMKRGGSGMGSEPVKPEDRSYDEMMDEITEYHVGETNIIEILRDAIPFETLKRWSEALNRGIKRSMTESNQTGNSKGDRETLREIYRFILDRRILLLTEPSMKMAMGMGNLDPISVCIVCGIRALQKERNLPGLMSTMKFRLMERYFS